MQTPTSTLVKEFTVSDRYLILPVKNGSEKWVMQILLDGQMVREFSIELAQNDPPDWWAFYEIGQFTGRMVQLNVLAEVATETLEWLAQAVHQSDTLRDAGDLYQERYRPQFHFTTRRGWNNDPNGMVFDGEKWHLYYQYNPFGVTWGNMHWGHAASTDLVHWEEFPIALYQRTLRDMAFSGGGLIDSRNSSGYQQGQRPPLVFAFTSTGRGECMAYSNDQGTTLTEFKENPVLRHLGRDPKVLWYEPGQKWVMIVYEEVEHDRWYAIYDSLDLKKWTRRSFLPGFFECPELFELALEGDPDKKYWVIHGCLWEKSKSTCLVGQFDGSRFTTLHENLHAHYGPQFYAAQVFSDAPGQRRVMIGWLEGAHFPGMPFSQAMTVPLELSLRRTSQGLRLCFYPVEELDLLHEGVMAIGETTLVHANRLLAEAAVYADRLDIHIKVSIPEGHSFLMDIRGYPLVYHPRTGDISFAGSLAHLGAGQKYLDLRVLVDTSVTEIFANGGEAAFSSMTIFEPEASITLGGDAWVTEMQVYRMGSSWK